jgi:FkbH-like protein
VVFVAVHWRDLGLGGVSNDLECVERVCAEHQQLWQLLTERTQCAVVQHSFDLPPDEASGYFSDAAAGGRGRIIQRINEALIEAAPANVSILNIQRVAASVGAAWENPALWYRAKQHPSPEALPALAERQIAHLRAISGLTKKVLVCDLDNTLWGGVIGEDGLDGIEVGPGGARSEAYADFQRYLLELKAQGVLLAVCSKNNMDEALLPFAKHEHMILRHTDFVAFVANWNDKASNIRAIAHELSLGTDSFVFVDDNPLEREWVRSQMPEVAVVELGQHPYSFVRDLDRCNYFFSLVSSTEDRNRTISYRSEKAREQLRDSAASLDGFLQSLKLRARCVPISSGNLARVAQLVNKTNQFNFTAKRYTEAQIQQLAAIPGAWVRAFQLADGFGDYGLIGVMICLPTSEGGWIVDSWLMSCRSLGRGMEKFMFNHMAQAALRASITNIGLSYRKTAKNGLVEGLPLQLGFKHIGTLGDETLYESEVSKIGQQQTFIADAPSSLAESGSGRLNQQPQPSIPFQTASGQVAH